MSVSLETSQSITGHATPHMLGVSPRMGEGAPFSIVTASPSEIYRRFKDEDAILGTVCELMAVHNGMPYTEKPHDIHFMLAPSDTKRFIPHPEACEPEMLQHMVGIARTFIRTEPSESRHIRLAGYNIADPRAHKQPLEKGLQAQTWNTLHIHHLEISPTEMENDFDRLPIGEQRRARHIARLKSSDLMPHSVSLLARGVVRDAWKAAGLSAAIRDASHTPLCVAPGSVTVDVTGVPDDQYAQCLRAWHTQYAQMHKRVSECLIDGYGEAQYAYTLLPSQERARRIERLIGDTLRNEAHTEHEKNLFRRQMRFLAHRVQSEEAVMNSPDPSMRIRQAESLVWRLPAYSVGMHTDADRRELLTMRPALTTNGGVTETLGFCPIRDRGAVIDPTQYNATHDRSRIAFQQAAQVYGPMP